MFTLREHTAKSHREKLINTERKGFVTPQRGLPKKHTAEYSKNSFSHLSEQVLRHSHLPRH
jgi:hypothetical protein